jgi:diguanylate cyclase (GGDEF)-like protein/PAS domain S-box-containing protein
MSATTEENVRRLRVLRATQLLESPPEAAFDRLTRLAAGLLNAPVALVSLVDEERQFFKSALGLAEPWASRRETPLTHSFCQYVTRDRAALVVSDAREHAVLRDNRAIEDLGVIAYAGIPLIVANEAVGAFCVVDDKPRAWSTDEVALLTDLAGSVVSEIELRLALREAHAQRLLTDALLESLGDGVLAVDPDGVFLIANAAARRLLSDEARVGQSLPTGWAERHQSARPDGTPIPIEEGSLVRGLRGHATDGLEFTLIPPGGGEAIWVESSGRPVRSVDGKVTAAIAVYRDVTARKRQADLYATLAGQIPRAAVFLFDKDLHCLAIDGALARERGLTAKDLVGRSMRALAGFEPGDSRFDAVEEAYRRTLAGESVTLDFVNRGALLALHTAPVHDAGGRVTTGIVLAFDVTEERRVQAALSQRDQAYRAIVEHLPNSGVMMVDRELRYVAAEGPVMVSVTREANLTTLVGRLVAEVSSETNREALLTMYRSVLEGNGHHLEIQRGTRFYDLDAVPIYAGETVSHGLVVLYDATGRKAEIAELETARAALEEQARELKEAAVTDELTGLHNRRGFSLIADQQLKIAAREGHKRVVYFVDLNGMKAINDTLGHDVGDRALVDAAAVLRRTFRAADIIARLGGDEFVVLATDSRAASEASVPSRLANAITRYNESATAFRLSLSLGSAVFDPAKPATLDALLAEADARMYEAKQAHHRLAAESGAKAR